MRTPIALVLMTANLVRRLLRQGIVVRSLTFPAGLVLLTLVLTVSILGYIAVPDRVVLSPSVEARIAEHLTTRGWEVVKRDDPEAAVKSRAAMAGTDGHHLYVNGGGSRPVRALEADLRDAMGTRWRLTPTTRLPQKMDAGAMTMLVSLMALLFSLYGVVFGAGMVARDRDDGTLEADLALPVPRWIHGASRWLAGGSLLALFYGATLALFDAFMGIEALGAAVRHGMAASSAAVGVGLAVIGRGGIKQGFSGPLAVGLTVVTGLLISGPILPEALGRWIPMSSMGTGASGWEALAGAAVVGAASIVLFTWRAARG